MCLQLIYVTLLRTTALGQSKHIRVMTLKTPVRREESKDICLQFTSFFVILHLFQHFKVVDQTSRPWLIDPRRQDLNLRMLIITLILVEKVVEVTGALDEELRIWRVVGVWLGSGQVVS